MGSCSPSGVDGEHQHIGLGGTGRVARWAVRALVEVADVTYRLGGDCRVPMCWPVARMSPSRAVRSEPAANLCATWRYSGKECSRRGSAKAASVYRALSSPKAR